LLYEEDSLQLDLGSDLDETYNSIKCTGMVWASSKAGPEAASFKLDKIKL